MKDLFKTLGRDVLLPWLLTTAMGFAAKKLAPKDKPATEAR